MPDRTAKYLLSDANSLRKIKFAQFRKQIPPLILLALAIALNTIFPSQNLYSVALALALIAVAWYLFIGFCHRFKQRIPLPPELAMVSPIQGKIAYIRGNGDVTLIGIRKIILDSVEIRSPHSSCQLEDGALHLDEGIGRISFRFEFKNIQWFTEAEHSTGNIIGMAVGAGSCTISIPGKPVLTVQPGDPIDAGDTLIADITNDLLKADPKTDKILEVIPDMNKEDDEI